MTIFAPPEWAKAVIVAYLDRDDCDIQSDYFNTKSGPAYLLAWSRHTRDRFDELRKAALLLPETRHMGPGCDLYTSSVVFAEDCQENGAYYREGQGSPWHGHLYGPWPNGFHSGPTFTTRAEAEAFICEKGDPDHIGVGTRVVAFRWLIWAKSVEHREKYSMGAGYYLKAAPTYSTGWKVEKWELSEHRMTVIREAFENGRAWPLSQETLRLPKAKPAMTDEEASAETARLRAENARLKASLGIGKEG